MRAAVKRSVTNLVALFPVAAISACATVPEFPPSAAAPAARPTAAAPASPASASGPDAISPEEGGPPPPAGRPHVLAGDDVWSGEVFVEGDLLVPRGRTLRLMAGTRIHLLSGEREHHEPGFSHPGPEIVIRGRIVAEGTPEEPVVFRSATDGAAPTGAPLWGGILFDGGGGRLLHSRIIGAERGMVIVGSSPELEGVRIESAREGLLVLGRSLPRLEEVSVDAGQEGFFCGPAAQPVIHSSRFKSSYREAFVAAPGCAPEITETSFEGRVISSLWAYREQKPSPPASLRDAVVRPLRMEPLPLEEPVSNLFADAAPPPPGRGETMLRGDEVIASDEVWSGTVIVDGVVTVAPEATLVIEPGTTVRFSFRDTDGDGRGESGLHVKGVLRAVGEAVRPIRFTGETHPSKGLWGALIIEGGERKSVFRYCVVESSQHGIAASGALLSIADSVFRENGRGAGLTRSRAVIVRSTFSGNREAAAAFDSTLEINLSRISRNGVGLIGDYAEVHVNYCVVEDSALSGIDLRYSIGTITATFLRRNTPAVKSLDSELTVNGGRVLRNNLHGFLLLDSDLSMIYSMIASNSGNGLTAENSVGRIRKSAFLSNLRYSLENASEHTFDAAFNYWSLDDRAFHEVVFDREDDPRLGPVTTTPTVFRMYDYINEEQVP